MLCRNNPAAILLACPSWPCPLKLQSWPAVAFFDGKTAMSTLLTLTVLWQISSHTHPTGCQGWPDEWFTSLTTITLHIHSTCCQEQLAEWVARPYHYQLTYRHNRLPAMTV